MKYLVYLLIPLLLSCESEKPTIKASLLIKSWMFEINEDGEASINSQGELKLFPLEGSKVQNGNGMQFNDNGRLIMFKMLNGVKQDMNFIHGIWSVKQPDKIHLNLDGTKPVFTVIELTEEKLILKKDAVLAD